MLKISAQFEWILVGINKQIATLTPLIWYPNRR